MSEILHSFVQASFQPDSIQLDGIWKLCKARHIVFLEKSESEIADSFMHSFLMKSGSCFLSCALSMNYFDMLSRVMLSAGPWKESEDKGNGTMYSFHLCLIFQKPLKHALY